MKAVWVVVCALLVACAVVVNGQSCAQTTCVAPNATCEVQASCTSTGDPGCALQCPPPLGCVALSFGGALTCQASLIGAQCNVNSDCQSDEFDHGGLNSINKLLVCSAGRCALDLSGASVGGMTAGDACETNTECQSSDCDDGTCAGAGEGAPCTNLGECNTDLICAGICLSLPGEGEACSGACNSLSLDCEGGSEGFCQPRYRFELGEPCTASTQCEQGTKCDDLTDAQGTRLPFSKCMDEESEGVEAEIGRACDVATPCPPPMTCDCNSATGLDSCASIQTQGFDCSGFVNAFTNCISDNGCSLNSNPLLENSCSGQCYNELIKLQNCRGTNGNAFRDVSCAYVESESAAAELSTFVAAFF